MKLNFEMDYLEISGLRALKTNAAMNGQVEVLEE